MNTIKAIFINAKDRTIEYIEIPQGKVYDTVRSLVFKDQELGYLEAYRVGANHHIYIDEEGVLKDWDQQHFFMFRVPPKGVCFAGNAVMLQEDGMGADKSVGLPISMVRETVHWITPQEAHFPAPMITTWDANNQPITTPMEPGVTEWTYNSRPA